MRVQVLVYEKADQKIDYLLEIFHLLQESGHQVSFSQKTLTCLAMDKQRVARFVEANKTDAWVVVGSSREILEWFAQQETPAFALFGRLVDVDLASTSPKKAEAYAEAVDRLVAYGHHRIVHLAREERRKPTPGFVERHFLERLKNHEIEAGTYNLPDWEDHPEGLQTLLSSLFQYTPPTAMIIDGPILYSAVTSYLSSHRILVPDQVSLICTDPDPTFTWCRPEVTHMVWDTKPLIRRVVKWVDNISSGKDDRRKNSTKAELILGGTIGPAPKT